jgi:exosortase/archaeosortase family protein
MGIKKQSMREFYDIVIRYLFLILIALPNLYLLYLILTPLTVYPVYWLLKITYGAFLLNANIILIGDSIALELIGACIAGAAYYLLLILNLTTREIPIKKRALMILLSFAAFLIINVLRIFFLSALAFSQTSFFDITHKIFWYSLSTILVLAIWFAEVKLFKIKAIPIYSDFKFLFKKINKK